MDSQVMQKFEQQNIKKKKKRNPGNKDNARERRRKKESSQRYYCIHETRTETGYYIKATLKRTQNLKL